MSDISAGQFTIDSSLDLAADSYTAQVAGSATYLAAADADTITLEAGLIDPATSVAYRVGHLVGGIDEYELSIEPSRITGRIQGRDRMAELIGRRYQKRYLRAQPTPNEQDAMEDRLFDGAADPIVYVVGTFRASEIAKEVVESCGLTLSWECRDYTLLEGFDANGRPLDILRTLVEPWSQVEALKVDILVQGTTVICRPRALTLTPDYTYSVTDARIKQKTLRKRRARRYGKVTLLGKLVPPGTGVVTGSLYTANEVDETKTSETTDEAGTVIQRVTRTTTYRMPEKVPIRVHEQTYDRQAGGLLVLVKDEQTENEWEDAVYDERGATTQPRQKSQLTNSRMDKLNGKSIPFQVVSRAEVSFGYDIEEYQDITTTRKWELKKIPAVTSVETIPAVPPATEDTYIVRELVAARYKLEEKERVTRTLAEVSHLEVEEVTSVYKVGTAGNFYLSQRDAVKSAGVRPAGPRPGRTIVIGAGDTGPKAPITVEHRVSSHVWAQDVQYSNPNLEDEDLDFILAQFQVASGLWAYELTMTYLAMPWIRKGNVLQLTGLLSETGAAIPLGPALVVNQELTYDESSASPSMLSRLTARWWAA